MEAFDPISPQWTQSATHALQFFCPHCGASSHQAQRVWINRRAPVIGENYQRKWQEFYQCECDRVWWAWSSDRPPTELSKRYQESQDNPDPEL
ncbi:hypothetical protein [Spirulina sp. 06S082]|uniref:hypothetical protein n=1 Tax=Spirulina sp. 06S082 TaxID=3110248 RepID=UPI002B20BF1C|nr:hypothetical protein [Spirulina sp. 06S082]MEA5471363.1 hypothetical protein [Spirulina sp. 06S082]